jgi:fructuronate reductase
MVDSITPATDERTREAVRSATAFNDAIPVSREAYTAWIIEDVLPEGSPDLASVGAVLTKDVASYELAKLRILNGAHSSLAYLGLLIGHDTVSGAMDDAVLAAFVERLIRQDIIPGIAPAFDLQHYASEILARFRNPAIGHKLAQIAWDGSQKLPYRLLDTVRDALQVGRPVDRLAIPVAAWMLFVERQARAGIPIVDPLAARLADIGRGGSLVPDLFALRQVFSQPLAVDPTFTSAVTSAVAAMRDKGPLATIGEQDA